MEGFVLVAALLVGYLALFGIKYLFAALFVSSLRDLKESERHAYYDDPDGTTASPQDRDAARARNSSRRQQNEHEP